jgi:O-antigen ligase
MLLALIVVGLICALGLTLRYPVAATVVWILVVETSPDDWLYHLVGHYEAIIGGVKAAGLAVAGALALRFGVRTDRYNPAFAFCAMFLVGLGHGLYPGLSWVGSLRSLLGSAAPFAFGFVRAPAGWARAVVAAVLAGPLVTVGFGLVLSAAGLGSMYDLEQGAMRLGASGEPPFLAGFCLVAVYAGLMELCGRGGMLNAAMLGVNFVILLLTGARAPLAIAVVLTLIVLLAQRRLMVLAAAGVLVGLALLFASQLHFIRAVNLVHLGEAGSLSNRQLVWPYFERAIAGSPWVGWGVGAGKVVVPLAQGMKLYIGTNAAHNEYLRIGAEGGLLGVVLLMGLLLFWVVRHSRGLPAAQMWLMRGIFLAFAVHSATDNTLIATTSSVMFVWVSAVFAGRFARRAAEGTEAA